jgi:site-specific DNA-methyltransferase (adenine-specific)
MIYPNDFIDQIVMGDNLEVLKDIPDNSIDTCLCDPPYGLSFMGKEWDSFGTDLQRYQEWTRRWASEVLRVAKPGATLLAFGGTRTFHRLACGLEDAGWEIRDTLMWLYGSGFPKSLNISKAIDKMKGAEREVIGKGRSGKTAIWTEEGGMGDYDITAPATPESEMWEGYGTALKPAYEPIIMAMKPLDGTFAENALKWGVAGLNIDEARIGTEKVLAHHAPSGTFAGGEPNRGSDTNYYVNQGRFPANLLLDEVSAEMLDEQSGIRKGWASQRHNKFNPYGGNALQKSKTERMGYYEGYNDVGGASRFFYVAKASKSERESGLEGQEQQDMKVTNYYGLPRDDGSIREIPKRSNNHPTVKPIKLMDYLVKLTKMPNETQIYLDPFLGSGTTAIAVVLNGRHYIGIEREPEYIEIAKARIKHWSEEVQE